MGVAGRCSGLGVASVNGCGRLNGIDDLLIPRAAAEVALNGQAISSRVGIVFVQQSLGSDEETGRAKTALGAAVGRKAGLNGGQSERRLRGPRP
jgi:hypothetical protein